jgi:hypothetical protein
MDELRARWPHELWLPQSHKSSGELVVSDDARVSSNRSRMSRGSALSLSDANREPELAGRGSVLV